MKKRDITILISFLVFFAASGCQENTYFQSIEGSVPTITVQGQGKVTAKPDEATVQLGVESEEKSLTKAYEGNTRDMNALIKTIKSMAIESEDIQTSFYNISPIYPVDERGRRLPGKPVSFRVSQQVTVRVRDLSKVGEFIDRAVESGGNIFRGVYFELSQLEEMEAQSKVKAIENTKEKANLLATHLGVKLGRILRVDESTVMPYASKTRMAFSTMAESSAPQIEPGSMEVTANCTVIYEIIQ